MISTYRNAWVTAMILCASLFVGHAYGTPADGSPARAARVIAPSASTVQQPSPEMQSLTKAIAGRWSTEITYGPESPSSPKKVSHGEQVLRSGPGGYTLLEEERIGTSSGEQFLLALHWWDNEAKQFKGLLCNNSGTGACNVDTFYNSSLVWDGQTLSIDLNFTQAGKKNALARSVPRFYFNLVHANRRHGRGRRRAHPCLGHPCHACWPRISEAPFQR